MRERWNDSGKGYDWGDEIRKCGGWWNWSIWKREWKGKRDFLYEKCGMKEEYGGIELGRKGKCRN